MRLVSLNSTRLPTTHVSEIKLSAPQFHVIAALEERLPIYFQRHPRTSLEYAGEGRKVDASYFVPPSDFPFAFLLVCASP